MNKYLAIALEEAHSGVQQNHGGPFGAVIVKDNEIIARAHNMVLSTNDPTAHAEIVAIRKATSILGRFDLSDCTIYSTCEPCPMCLGAIYWAKIPTLYYACTRTDAALIGFDDEYIYQAIGGTATEHRLNVQQIGRESCLELFNIWQQKTNKRMY